MMKEDPWFSVSFRSVVRGYVYNVWSPLLNEVLPLQQERGSTEDCYAVSILKGVVIVSLWGNHHSG